MGSTCSVLNNTNGTMYCKFGPNLDVFSIILAVIGKISEFIPGVGQGISVVALAGGVVIQIVHLYEADQMNKMKGNIEDWFKNRGYSARGPGSGYVSEKLSLSLVVSAHCAILTDVGGGKLELRIGTMTCWTGPTDGTNYQYNVSDCTWGKILYPMNTGGDPTIAGLMDDSADITKVNLAEDKDLLEQTHKFLNAKGGSTPCKPGIQPRLAYGAV